ncbi:MAG TPA: TonB-dependent receptor [Holophagaceae bacterium]
MLCLIAGSTLQAQSTLTGNLTGTIRETETGKPIAGARVVAHTPQGDRTTRSDAQGTFRFALMIPGPVTLSVTADGYLGGSLATRVPLGGTNVTDFPLKPVAEASRTVTVVATANNIDTADARIGDNFAMSSINDLPIPATARTVTNIAALSPGVSADANGMTVRGAQSTQVLYLVDGADVADPVTGGFGAALNEDMLSEVQVLSGGISAEYGRFTGGVVQAVTKSGSNDFTGILRLSISDPDWNAYNPLDRGPSGAIRFTDTHSVQQNIVISGPILRDRLFFVVGYRAQAPFARSQSLQTTAPPDWGGGLPYRFTQTDDRKDIKIDWQITPSHRVFWQYNKTEIDQAGRDYANAFLGGSTSLATLSNQPNTFSYYTLGYQGQLKDNMLLELHYSHKKETLGGPGGGGQGGPNASVMIDLNTQYVYDNGFFGQDSDSRPIENGSASLLWFLHGAGEHEVKLGLDWYQSSHSAANNQAPNNQLVYFNGFTTGPGNPPAGGDTSIANRVFVPNDPTLTFLDLWVPFVGATTRNTIWAAYANDKWKFDGHWSFNLGLRADRYTSKDDLGARNFDLTALSPRLAVIWDIKGDGAWVAQASFGDYTGSVIQGATDNSSTVGNPAEYDYVYVAGDPNLRSSYAGTPFFVYDPSRYRHSNTIDPNLKMPTMQEVAITLKHADGGNGLWSVTVNRRRWKNFVDDFKDLQPNPVDGNDLTMTVIKNDPSLVRDYLGLELQYQKQFTEAFSLGGNLTLSQLQGNYEGGQVGSTEQVNNFGPLPGNPGAYPGTPTRDQLGGYGFLAADVPVRVRAFSNFTRKVGAGRLNVGAIFQFTSGAPYSKVAQAPLPATVPVALGSRYTEYFSQRGAMRFADTYRTDLQVAYDLPVWRKFSFFAAVNLTNVFNHQQLATWNTTGSVVAGAWTAGAAYGNPTSSGNYIQGRSMTLSTGLKF